MPMQIDNLHEQIRTGNLALAAADHTIMTLRQELRTAHQTIENLRVNLARNSSYNSPPGSPAGPFLPGFPAGPFLPGSPAGHFHPGSPVGPFNPGSHDNLTQEEMDVLARSYASE